MDETRFAPPRAFVVEVAPEAPFVAPEAVRQKIRAAWIAALISGVLTLLMTVMAMNGTGMRGFSAANLLDVALIALLGFGIHRRSRICATLMLVYFLVSKYWLYTKTGSFAGAVPAIGFCVAYGAGVVGTFQYHRLRRRAAEAR
jgi:K+-sensing histidine kinase KdpD